MTRRVALIGQPLRRPHSAVMHNAAFAHAGIDAGYELREIEPGEIPHFAAEARGEEWLGFQVTAPYKEAIVAHLDRIEEAATEIGAVNSVAREVDGSLTGFNTDAPGFVSAVRAAGVGIAGASVLVAGAGGAARAVVWGLLRDGASRVVVANRTRDRAVALCDSLSYLGELEAVALDDPDLGAVLGESRIAVNATTVGMTTGGAPFPVDRLPAEAAVFDLVYVPPVTPLVEAAGRRGMVVRNGLDMLVEQARIAFERWTGIGDVAAVMRSALESQELGTNHA